MSVEVFTCTRHPDVETVLRCGRCDTPICPRCMVPTPVGARCRTCAGVKRFPTTAKPIEMLRAVAAGLAVPFVAQAAVIFVPILGLFGMLWPAIIGFATGWAVSNAARGKRARELAIIALACFLVGYLLAPVLSIGMLLLTGGAVRPDLLVGLAISRITSLTGLIGLGLGGFLAWMRAR